MKFLSKKNFRAGDKKVEVAKEAFIDKIKFNVFKFNNRPRPQNSQEIIIISSFSEFGCEMITSMYLIPKILQEHPGKYIIVMGWYGREYLYRHLVDEFLEIKEEFQWLRDHARAFHNESRNVKLLEKKMRSIGRVITCQALGRKAVGTSCNKCRAFWGSVNKVSICPYCKSEDIKQSLDATVADNKPFATRVPIPSDDKILLAKKYLGHNPVGIFARGRNVYGRNLPSDFYVDLINLLKNKGYTPIWLGEKQSTLPCPVSSVIDFSRMEESRDLEMTLAIISQLKFTIQYWTASTRLAAIMGVPYILFESPDQIFGGGQEGYRLNLCSFGPKKMCFSHYLNFLDDLPAGLRLTERCIDELSDKNYEDIIGLTESELATTNLKKENFYRVGGS